MQTKIILSFVFCFVSVLVVDSQTTPQISADSLEKHVYYLASDELQGRNTGSEGQKIAAKYIADYFNDFGLIPAGNSDNNPYFQEFFISEHTVLFRFPMYQSKMMPFQKSARHNFIYFGTDENSGKWQDETICTNPVNCCEHVQMFRFFRANNLNEVFDSIRIYHRNCHNNKFICLLPALEIREVAKGQPERNSLFYSTDGEIKSLTYGNPGKYIDNSQYCLVRDFVTEMKGVELILVSPDFLIERGYVPHEPSGLDSVNFSIFKGRMHETINTENVIGFIEGGKNKSQVIVIGAHYDHIGTGKAGIFNGADDNASGTAALIELARHFSMAKQNDELDGRSILFIAFTGEEKGLLGSDVYMQFPTFSVDSTIFMLNMDMIGRPPYPNDKKGVVFYASYGNKKKDIKKIVKKSGRQIGSAKAFKNSGFLNSFLWRHGSDHDRFVNQGISSVVFFTGLHEDYHKSTDTAEKLNYKNMSEITKLMYLTAYYFMKNN